MYRLPSMLLCATLLGVVPVAEAAAEPAKPAETMSAEEAEALDRTFPDAQAVYVGNASIPFDLFRGSRIFLHGKVNGQAAPFMFDSGASRTVIDSEYAKQIGISGGKSFSVQGAAGSVPARITCGVNLAVGALRLKRLCVYVMDMSPVARAIGREIPVVLGRDAMKAGLVTIDFPRRTVAFHSRVNYRPPAGTVHVPLGNDGGLRTVELTVADAAPIHATFDLGHPGTLILANSYWKNRPEFASLRKAETQIGGVGGAKTARKVTLPDVKFAGTSLTNVPAILNDDPAALPTEGGNVGIEMLKPFVVTIDDVGGALYLKPTGDTHSFQRERAGLRTELAGDRLVVRYVSADGPAAAAGLKAGDEIVAVSGQSVGPNYYATERLSNWSMGPAGSRVPLKLADGSIVTIKLADYY